MDRPTRPKPAPRFAMLSAPTAAVRWDLALAVMLALLGVLGQPGSPR